MKHVLAAALAFVALGATAQAETDKVRFVLSANSFAFMPFFVADSEGYFEKNGIDMELIRANSGAAIITTLVSGGADVAVVGMNEVLTAKRAGVDLAVLGAAVRQYTSMITYSKEWAEQHGITEASPLADKFASLKGINIAVTGHGAQSDLVAYLAGLAGLDPDRDLTIVPLGADPVAHYAAMEEGRVDAMVFSAPHPQRIRRELGGVVAFNTARGEVEQLDGYPFISVSSTREWAQSNPELVERVSDVFVAALTAITDPAQTRLIRDRVHQAYFAQIEKPIFDDAWEDYVAGTSADFSVAEADIRRVVDFLNQISSEQIDLAAMSGVVFQR